MPDIMPLRLPDRLRQYQRAPPAEYRGDHSVSDARRGLVVAQLTQAIFASDREDGRPIAVGALG